MEIYGKIQAQKLDQGRSTVALAAASLYAACRNTGDTKTLKEVSKASGVKRKSVARLYRFLLNELELKVTVTDPAACVSIVSRRVGLLRDKNTTALALKILKDRGVAPSLAGKDPMGLAGAALYMACIRNGKAKKMEKKIARAAGVTEATIIKRRNGLKSVIEERGLIDECFCKHRQHSVIGWANEKLFAKL